VGTVTRAVSARAARIARLMTFSFRCDGGLFFVPPAVERGHPPIAVGGPGTTGHAGLLPWLAMARAIWSGTLSFGLVSIPVRLFPATAPKDVRFHQFDRDTGRRIRYRRVAGDAPAPDPFLRQPSQGGEEVPGAREPEA